MQSTSVVLMVEPERFEANTETAATNKFQIENPDSEEELNKMAQDAIKQHSAFRQQLESIGVSVIAVNGVKECPDDIFPNNWFSTHHDIAILYPMCNDNRRTERREDVISLLKEQYSNFHDLSDFENDNKFLEGTGSMVMDHDNKLIYAALSQRTNDDLVAVVADILGYKKVTFYSFDRDGDAIYHTNVMMFIGSNLAGICSESIPEDQRQAVLDSLYSTHDVMEIDFEQMENFLANALEIKSNDGKEYLAMSSCAYAAIIPAQMELLEKHYGTDGIIHADFSVPERAGGSIRCSMAEIFLPEDKDNFLQSAKNHISF